jgi:hypothetical protein
MGMLSDTVIEKKRRRVAANYRRQGYQVTLPKDPATLPSFLRDCHPDLIAEREDDHVVIEIKPSRALKGSNDLQDLAARVAAQPGWRLERGNRPWIESMPRSTAVTGSCIIPS